MNGLRTLAGDLDRLLVAARRAIVAAGQPAPQPCQGRFMVGLLAGDQSRIVAFGTVQLRFAYLGDRGSAKPAGSERAPVTAVFLPIPGQHLDPAATGPRFGQGSDGIGVYGAPDVGFDRPGFWQVSASATIGGKPTTATAAFEVLAARTPASRGSSWSAATAASPNASTTWRPTPSWSRRWAR